MEKKLGRLCSDSWKKKIGGIYNVSCCLCVPYPVNLLPLDYVVHGAPLTIEEHFRHCNYIFTNKMVRKSLITSQSIGAWCTLIYQGAQQNPPKLKDQVVMLI